MLDLNVYTSGLAPVSPSKQLKSRFLTLPSFDVAKLPLNSDRQVQLKLEDMMIRPINPRLHWLQQEKLCMIKKYSHQF